MLKVLAIDDNKDNLISLKALVNEAFPEAGIFMAENGMSGLKIAEAENPDVILLDVVMPDMDGFEVCRKLKSTPALKDIPVVFVTALKGDRESRIKALEVGAEAFLAKPIDETELTAQIRAMVKIKEANINKRDEKAFLEALVASRTEDLNKELTERKKAEGLLMESEIKFRSITEQLSDLIAITDQQGVIQYASQASETLFAVKPDLMEGTHFSHFLDESSIPAATKAFTETIEKKSGMITLELQMKRADGKRFFGEIKAMFYNYGFIPGTLISIRDISERRKSEDLIRQNEKKFRNLFDNQIESYALHQIILDNNGNPIDYRFLEVNKSFLIMTGLNDRSEVIGKTVLEIWPDTDQHWIQTYGKVALTQEQITFENFSTPLNRHYLVSAYSTEIGVFATSFMDITMLKNAESKLNEIKNRYQSLFENSLIGTGLSTQEGQIIECNEAFAEMLGYHVDEMKTFNVGEFYLAPTTRNEIVNILQKEQSLIDYETTLKRKDHELIDVLLNISVINLNGLTFFQTTCLNITERKRAETALIESEHFSNSVTNATPALLYIYDLDEGRNIWSNDVHKQFFKDLNETVSELVYDDISQLVNPDDFKRLVKKTEEILLAGKSDRLDEEIRIGLDSTWKWVKISISVFKRKMDGQPSQMLGAIFDIDDRKKAEEELLESEERFRALHNASFGGIAIHDKGIILACNKGMSEMTGYSMEELIGMNGLKLISDKVVDVVVGHIKAGYEKPYESICHHKNGNEFPIRIESRNIPYKGKTVRVTEFRDITEQKEAVIALKNSHEMLKKLTQQVPGVVYQYRLYPDGRSCFPFSSQGMMDIYGYYPEDLTEDATPVFGRIHPDDYDAVSSAIYESARTQELFHIEFRVILPGQGTRWRLCDARPELLNDGSTLWYGIITDISERKKSEQYIKDSEERFRLLVKNVSSIIVTIDADGVQRYVSPAVERLTGFTPAEVTGKAISEIIHPEDFPQVKKAWDECIRAPGKSATVQYRHIHKTKGWVYLEAIGQNFLNEPSVNAFIASVRDVTGQKQTEKLQRIQYNIANAVATSKSMNELFEVVKTELNQLIDTTNFFIAFYNEKTNTLQGAYQVDENDDIDEWPASKSLSGIVVTEGKSLLLYKEDINELYHKGRIDLIGAPAEFWLGVPLKLRGKVIGAMVVQTYDKDSRIDKSSMDVLEIIANQISLYIENLRDEEQLIIAKEQAEAGDRLKTAFMNNISHEIRTPLSGILGFAPMLLETDLSDNERQEYLNILETSSARLINTITDYMDISLIVSANLKINRSTFDVLPFINELNEELQVNCRTKSINSELEIHKLADDFKLDTDKELLQKALKHLLSNAVKFTNEGKITLGCRLQSGEVEFFVKDTGVGISEDAKIRVFQNFGQEQISITRDHEGSGLGLSIAKGIIELLGGSIRMVSEKGIGSEFYLVLPCVFERTSGIAPKMAETSPKIKDKPLILIAEDEESNSMFLKILLQKAGYEVILVLNGKEAVEQCRIHPQIGLIFMDIKMPVMNGLEATKLIKQFRPNLPIVAVTAHALTGDEHRIREAGCDDYISKPVKIERIFDVLNKQALIV